MLLTPRTVSLFNVDPHPNICMTFTQEYVWLLLVFKYVQSHLSEWTVNFNDIELGDRIGKGRIGEVYKYEQ